MGHKNNKKQHKEIGIPANAPAYIKKLDEKADKKGHITEGSKTDIKKDKAIMKRGK